MAEVIPVAPDSQEGGAPDRDGPDKGLPVGEAFDEDILSDIENHLDGGEDLPADYSPRDKVELDKADLPLDFEEPEPPPPKPQPEPDQDQPDLAIDEPEETPSPPPGPLKANLHWVVAGGALLVLLVVVAAWILGGAGKRGAKQPTPWIVRGRIVSPEKLLRMDLEPFLVQLARTNRGQILKVSVSLEVMQPSDLRYLRAKLAACRDVIYRTLAGRTAAELASHRGKDLLRQHIQAALNQTLGGQRVYKVYFTKFLISG